MEKKRKAKEVSGKSAFWVGWPLLYLFMSATKRTRVLVVSGDKVLVVKSWLGSGRWGLPGGGMKFREAAVLGAIRELFDETGIKAKPNDLKFMFSRRSRSEQGIKYTMYAYLLELPRKPKLTLNGKEIADSDWLDWHKLRDDPKTSQNIKDMIRAWQHSKGEDLPAPPSEPIV